MKITGRIPDASDARLYQLQVGAYRITKNAENSYGKLITASLNPSYEKYGDLTRVLIKGIKAADVPVYIEKI
jgi:rare lipoprotein A